MRYFGIIKNDVVNTKSGFTVSLFIQGCDIHCPGCHNPQTWDFNGGIQKSEKEIIDEIIKAINANGIKRDFSILGGEPLAPGENTLHTAHIVQSVRAAYPDIKIYLWSGYTYEQIRSRKECHLINILKSIDVLIEGPYVESERDITLPLRGSRNQNIYEKDKSGVFVKLT